MDCVKAPLQVIKQTINGSFANKEPWQIVSVTATSVLFLVWFKNFIFQDESVVERAKKKFYKEIKRIPAVKAKLDSSLGEIEDGFKKSIDERYKSVSFMGELPAKGITYEEVAKILKDNLSLGEYDWKKGQVSGSVYYDDDKLKDFLANVYGQTSYTNPLHPDVFPGLCKMEAEVVKIVAKLFNGDEETCGTMTSGGTESILMACKACRDYGRETKGIKTAEIIVPKTVHAAFDKAAQYFDMKIVYIDVDPQTRKVDVKAMRRAITSRTVLLVGSAPNFPYGVIDDIKSIAKLGVEYNIPVHVDSCLGGFLTAFMTEAGYELEECDFRVKGVTSISVDTHKYAFTPKGSSVILYKNKKFLHQQYTITTDWPGGMYGSPTVNGSRPGGSIAVCWATLLKFGKEGYVNACRDIIRTTLYIEQALRELPEIFIFGKPATSVIAIGSKKFEIYRLVTALSAKGWNLNALQYPSGFHLCVTHIHTQKGIADQFIGDIKEAIKEIMKTPDVPTEGKMALYGMAQTLPDRTIVKDFVRIYLDSSYYETKK